MNADLAASRVSVLMPPKNERSKSGEEWTNTFLSSIVAFGNFLMSERR
jgi:hypothetical protein